MKLNDDITTLTRRIVEAVHPEKIILFGSRARADSTSSSDIDLLVIVKDGVHRRETSAEIYRKLAGSGMPVDVVVATTNDIATLGDSPAYVYRYALKDGVQLYAA